MTVEKPQLRGRRGALRARQGHLRASDPSKRGFFDSHIIAILAAILFPVFAKAREKARQSSCLSNVKQLSLGVIQYCQDYDEVLPRVGINYAIGWYSWTDAIQPYLKSTQILKCPSDQYQWGYGMSGGLCGGETWGITTGRALGSIVRPAETLIIADSTRVGYDNWYRSLTKPGWGHARWNCTANGVDGMPRCRIAERHNDGGNVGFVDGHAKWMRMDGTKPFDDVGSLWGHNNASTPVPN